MDRRLFLFIILAVFSFSLILIAINLNNPILWYDEAVQFWMSKGLNNDADPLQEPGGFLDVVENNANYNHSPGGFTLLLHFWSFISNSAIWLRVLPFLFYIGIIASFIALSYSWTNDLRVAILAGFVPLLDKFILAMGFEIRGYSMEYLGSMLGVIAFFDLKKNFSNRHLFLWGCILAFFMTARYSISVIYFVLSVYLLFWIYKNKGDFKHVIKSGFFGGTPLLISFATIYVLALRFQNPNLEKMFYLPYLADDWVHLVNPRFNLVFLILFLALILLTLIVQMNKLARYQKYLPLFHITIFTVSLFLILSIAGVYPWQPNDKYGLSYSILLLISLSAIAGEVLLEIFNRKKFAFDIMVIFALLASLFIHVNDRYYHRIHYRDSRSIHECFKNLNYSEYDQIYVDRWASPMLKYQFEYGFLAQDRENVYPQNFYFQKAYPVAFRSIHLYESISMPTYEDLDGYDLIIIPDPLKFKPVESGTWTPVERCESFVFRNTEIRDSLSN